MENAAEALKIAFGFMMFVLALALSISSFSQATQAVQYITTARDRETEYTYVEPLTDSNGNVITDRIVGVETVVPTMYKAYKENFKIIFLKKDVSTPLYLYTYVDPNGNKTNINYIDLENEILSGAQEAIEHLTVILNKKTSSPAKYRNQFLHNEGLYEYFKGKTFKEELGEYYQEDDEALKKGTTTSSDVLEINKTKKRVITYICQQDT